MPSKPLRCQLGIHAWTLVDGLRDQAPVYSPVECKRCDTRLDRLPHAWIDADGPRVRVAECFLGPRWIAAGLVVLFGVFCPLIGPWIEFLGAVI